LYFCNILLIDDDEITLELLRHILEQFIFGETYIFSSSIKALEFIQSDDASNVDLVLCDWLMPELNGLDILKSFRHRFKDCPFLMVSANPTKAMVIKAKGLGASDIIAKPFEAKSLTKKISQLMI
jgi:two-component system chemotaxis response regulator CheY